MKKTLIALAILGITGSMAHAQSNVTIYGIVDTGLIKETGTDVRMGSNVESRLGSGCRRPGFRNESDFRAGTPF